MSSEKSSVTNPANGSHLSGKEVRVSGQAAYGGCRRQKSCSKLSAFHPESNVFLRSIDVEMRHRKKGSRPINQRLQASNSTAKRSRQVLLRLLGGVEDREGPTVRKPVGKSSPRHSMVCKCAYLFSVSSERWTDLRMETCGRKVPIAAAEAWEKSEPYLANAANTLPCA